MITSIIIGGKWQIGLLWNSHDPEINHHKMSYLEKNLTADFSKFLRTNKHASSIKFSCVIEFKCKHNNEKLNFKRDFQPQQIPSLLQATTGCLYHKISDMSTAIKPFDAMQACYVPAFVGVLWYTPRKPKILYLIDVRDILEKKTLTEAEAEVLARFKINL